MKSHRPPLEAVVGDFECIIKEPFWKHKWRNQYAESKEGRDSDCDKDGSGDV